MTSWDDRRDERRKYEGDAIYEAWRRGLDTDRIDYDEIGRAYDNDRPPESIANDIQWRPNGVLPPGGGCSDGTL